MPEIRFRLHDRTVVRTSWPVVPGQGDIVTFDAEDRPELHGEFRVEQVRWQVGGGGELGEITVELVPGW